MEPDPETRAYGIRPPEYRLPDATHVGRVRLQVSDLARSLAYYRDIVGLTVLERDGSDARLGAADQRPLVELHQERGTRPVPRGAVLGLYHFALLLPSRSALSQFVRHLAGANTQFGAADHLVSEAIYLWDPDGLGIEVYADRPRSTWQVDGRELVMTTERLDLQALLNDTAHGSWSGLPEGTLMGHMHLSVGDLEQASRFYHRALGLDTTVWSYPGALFMSAGGYHHHLGTNTWAMGARLAGPSDARLLEWELVMPAAGDVDAAEASLRAAGFTPRAGLVTDPWGTSLRLTAAS
jgi:catechol 2,3-dioxygenase